MPIALQCRGGRGVKVGEAFGIEGYKAERLIAMGKVARAENQYKNARARDG